jgi:hypothetical protein
MSKTGYLQRQTQRLGRRCVQGSELVTMVPRRWLWFVTSYVQSGIEGPTWESVTTQCSVLGAVKKALVVGPVAIASYNESWRRDSVDLSRFGGVLLVAARSPKPLPIVSANRDRGLGAASVWTLERQRF